MSVTLRPSPTISSSYKYITVKLADGSPLQVDPILFEQEQETEALAMRLEPALGNCNNPELLLMTQSLHKLFKLLHDDYEKIFAQDFGFMKQFLFHPKYQKRYDNMMQEKIKTLLKQICKELKQSATLQPDKLNKAIRLLSQMKHFPSLNNELKQDINKTLHKLKMKKAQQQHGLQPRPTPTPVHRQPISRKKPAVKKVLLDDEDEPSFGLDRILNPTLRPR